MPEVSIIIPTFNRANFLKIAINSVLNQTYSDYEIIVVSNGSTDNSEMVVEKFQDPRIKFIKQEASGSPASPRNHGIRISKGNYIAFCDDDDIWLPEKLEQQMEFLTNNLQFGVCYTKMKRFNEQREWINYQEETIDLIDSKSLLYKNTVPLSSTIVRKNILEDFEWFDEAKEIAGAEDYELMLRLSKKTSMFCMQKYLILYYSGDARFSNTDSSIIKTNIKYLKRLFGVYKIVVGKKYFKWREVLCPFLKNIFQCLKIILYSLKGLLTLPTYTNLTG